MNTHDELAPSPLYLNAASYKRKNVRLKRRYFKYRHAKTTGLCAINFDFFAQKIKNFASFIIY